MIKTENDTSGLLRSSRMVITSLEEFGSFVDPLVTHQDKKYIYRGEPALYNTLFTPLIFRNGITPTRNLYKDKTITDQEIKAIEGFVKWAKTPGNIASKDLLEVVGSLKDNDVNWLYLAQHYGHPTRLLDVSFNPYVGLYFACKISTSNKAVEDDGYVYHLDSGNFRQLKEPKMDPSDPNFIKDLLDVYDVDKGRTKPIPELAYLFRPDILEKRLRLQDGAFLFIRAEKSVLSLANTLPIRIPSENKKDIMADLKREKDIDEDSLGLSTT